MESISRPESTSYTRIGRSGLRPVTATYSRFPSGLSFRIGYSRELDPEHRARRVGEIPHRREGPLSNPCDRVQLVHGCDQAPAVGAEVEGVLDRAPLREPTELSVGEGAVRHLVQPDRLRVDARRAAVVPGPLVHRHRQQAAVRGEGDAAGGDVFLERQFFEEWRRPAVADPAPSSGRLTASNAPSGLAVRSTTIPPGSRRDEHRWRPHECRCEVVPGSRGRVDVERRQREQQRSGQVLVVEGHGSSPPGVREVGRSAGPVAFVLREVGAAHGEYAGDQGEDGEYGDPGQGTSQPAVDPALAPDQFLRGAQLRLRQGGRCLQEAVSVSLRSGRTRSRHSSVRVSRVPR